MSSKAQHNLVEAVLLIKRSKINISLVITADLPSDEEIARVFAEPVKSLTIPTSIFLSNKSGFPVLSRAHQQFVKKFFDVSFSYYDVTAIGGLMIAFYFLPSSKLT